jgi:hypothetical protein
MNPSGKGGFQKGTSRKPREIERDYLARFRTRVSPDDWDMIIDAAIKGAKKGDSVDRKFLADYLIGPPVIRNEITGEDGGAIVIDLFQTALKKAYARPDSA